MYWPCIGHVPPSPAPAQEVADAGCLPRLATLLREGPEEVKQVAARGFASLSASCPPQRLQALVEEDAVAAAVALLEPEVPPQTVRPLGAPGGGVLGYARNRPRRCSRSTPDLSGSDHAPDPGSTHGGLARSTLDQPETDA